MEALWNTDKPMSVADIVERTGLSQAAVLPVLKRLMNKQYVEISAIVPHARTYMRIFRAIKGKDEIIKNQRLKTFPQFSDDVKALNSTKSSWKSREGNGEGKEIGERREKGE